jgi:hypothetical protein
MPRPALSRNCSAFLLADDFALLPQADREPIRGPGTSIDWTQVLWLIGGNVDRKLVRARIGIVALG